ncbi:MAG: peptidase domain protein [Gemmatimonadetes bacterium]|nr:peptidase domain protein [Gemmatimonadota bacterium]
MRTEQLDAGLFRSTASNGLVVLSETLPGVRSAAVGLWVRTASAHEPVGQMGISHLLEHMVFKGTERRGARELALALEERGGSLDAFTGRDTTSFQAHVLDRDLPLAVDVLTDLVRRPLLRESDLELERKVILEEISGVDDTPDDLVFELHARALWPEHPYGYSILGTRETVSALSAADVRQLHDEAYFPGNCVIAAAGNLEHEVLLAALDHEGWFAGAARPARNAVSAAPAQRGVVSNAARDTTQSHIVLGTDTFSIGDPRRFAMSILVNALGGGMSSRLFQRVREELGLAYAVYAYSQFHQGTGQLGIYVGTRPDTADAALEAIQQELRHMAASGLDAAELAVGKRQLQGQLMLALESPGARMSRLANFTLHRERYRTLDTIIQEIEAVPAAQVAAVAAEFLDPERQTVQRLGPEKP